MPRKPKKEIPEFAMKVDGKWVPCDPELCEWLDRSMADLSVGQPGSVVIRGNDGKAQPLSSGARHLLYLSVLALSARLYPASHKPRAYEALAAAHPEGLAELRKAFELPAIPEVQ